jgi:hypothetical protein
LKCAQILYRFGNCKTLENVGFQIANQSQIPAQSIVCILLHIPDIRAHNRVYPVAELELCTIIITVVIC